MFPQNQKSINQINQSDQCLFTVHVTNNYSSFNVKQVNGGHENDSFKNRRGTLPLQKQRSNGKSQFTSSPGLKFCMDSQNPDIASIKNDPSRVSRGLTLQYRKPPLNLKMSSRGGQEHERKTQGFKGEEQVPDRSNSVQSKRTLRQNNQQADSGDVIGLGNRMQKKQPPL